MRPARTPAHHFLLRSLVVCVALVASLLQTGAGTGFAVGLHGSIRHVVRRAGGAPPAIPLDARRPYMKPAHPVTPLSRPTATQLFGPAGSPMVALPQLHEDATQRSANGSVYKIGGGDHVIAASTEPQNYQDTKGVWHRIDTRLTHYAKGQKRLSPYATPTDDGSGGWQNNDGPASEFFPDALTVSSPITYSIPQGTLSILPLGITPGVQGASADGVVVTYADAALALDLTYTPNPEGYDEQVVLSQVPTATQFSWSIQTTDFTLELDPARTGQILVLSGTDVVAYFPAALVWDSSAVGASTTFPYTLQDLGGGSYVVTATYDSVWLNDPARVYPVTIDPGPQAHTFYSTGYDTFVTANDPAQQEGTWWGMDTGGATGNAITYIRFPLDHYYNSARLVYTTEMDLYAMDGPSGPYASGTVDVRRISAGPLFDETQLDYDDAPYPTVDPYIWDHVGTVSGDGWEHWANLGGLYQHIMDTEWNSWGLQLKSASDGTWHRWCTSNLNGGGCVNTPVSMKPQLYITYNDLPAAVTLSNPPDVSTVTVQSPELDASAMPTDVDGDPTRLEFQVSTDANTWVWPQLVADSGAVNSTGWVVPAGALQDGVKYYWRVLSEDWCANADGSEGVCSNVDADGITHNFATQATPRSFTMNLPHNGTDSRWSMWSKGLGNGMTLNVNQATGNVYLDYPLDSLSTPVGALALDLSYNSQLAQNIGMGPGWNISAGPGSDALKLPTTLTLLGATQGGGVNIAFGDGSVAHFSQLAPATLDGDTYSGEGQDGGTVVKASSPGPTDPLWTYTTDSGSVFTFDSNTPAQLMTAQPATASYTYQGATKGFAYTFAADNTGVRHLTTVTDPLQRPVTLTWTGTQLQELTGITSWVANVTGGGLQTWTLGYDPTTAKLTSITDPAGETVKFTYDATTGLLGTIQDAQSVHDNAYSTAITYETDTFSSGTYNRARTITLPPPNTQTSVNPTTFSYDGQLNGSIVPEAAMTDPRATVPANIWSPTSSDADTTWTFFNAAGLPVQVFGPYDDSGYAPSARSVWDNNGNIVCSRTPYADAVDDSKCHNPTDGNFASLVDSRNTDYTYQTTAPFTLTQVLGPDDGSGNRPTTSFTYDTDTAGVAWQGLAQQEFSGNTSLAGVPFDQSVVAPTSINWDWTSQDPTPMTGTGPFSLRLTGMITVSATKDKTYYFKLSTGGGGRLVIGSSLVVDCWTDAAFRNCGTTGYGVVIKHNVPTPIEIDYYHSANPAKLELQWDQGTGVYVDVPSSMLTPHIEKATLVADPQGTTKWDLSSDGAKFRNQPVAMIRDDRTTTYTYADTTYGRLTKQVVTLAGTSGLETDYAYTDGTDSTHGSCVSSTTDPAGLVTNYTCDAAGDTSRVQQVVPAVAGTNQATSQTRDVDTTYDNEGRVLTVSVPYQDGTANTIKTVNVYDLAGRLKQTTDPMNFVTTYTYDPAGDLLTKTLPSPDGVSQPPVWQYTYDAVGNQVSALDPRQHTFSSTYDAFDRLTSTTTPVNATTTFLSTTSYSFTARTVTTQIPGGVDVNNPSQTVTITQVTTNDLLGRPVSKQTGSLTADSYFYDTAGRVKSQTVKGVTTTLLYNSFGQVTQQTCSGCVITPGGSAADAIAYYTYDQAGRLSTVVDPRASSSTDPNHTWTYGYDGDGRVTSSTTPAPISSTTTVVYDAAGERLKVTDGAGNIRNWTYDYRGRVVSYANSRGSTSYAFDDDNRLYQVTLPAGLPSNQGETLTYAYDHLGRRTHRSAQTAGNQTVDAEAFGYDQSNNLTSASTDAGSPSAVSATYDYANRLSTVTQSSTTTTYVYQGTELSTMAYGAGTDSYAYRAGDGLVGTLTSAFGTSSAYGYDSYGRPTSRTDTQGGTTIMSTAMAYDAAGRPDQKQVTGYSGGNPVALSCFQTLYDAVGNVLDKLQQPTPTTCPSYPPASAPTGAPWWLYTYDNANRLSSATDPSSAVATQYQYDGAGNRTNVQVGTNAATVTHYDGSGFPTYASVSGATTTNYTVDAIGELDSIAPVGGQATTFTYDSWGRITQAVVPSGTYAYAYDALNREASKTQSAPTSHTTTFKYLGITENPASQTIDGATYQYAYTPGGPYAQKQGSTTRFYASDLHGDVVGLYATGASSYAGSTKFDPWGVVAGSSGTQGLFGYQGDPTDSATGLVDMITREYVPTLGRFATQDSVFGDLRSPTSLNQFVYANDDPISNMDPTGMYCIDPEGGICPSGASGYHPAPQGTRSDGPTIGYFQSLSVIQRIGWLMSFATTYHVGNWLNAIVGVLNFAGRNHLISDGSWFSWVDAGILQGISDGMRMSLHQATASTNPGARKWAAFFGAQAVSALPGAGVSTDSLKRLWGVAEEASTRWGAARAADAGTGPTLKEEAVYDGALLFRAGVRHSSGISSFFRFLGSAATNAACFGNPICRAVGSAVGGLEGNLVNSYFDPRDEEGAYLGAELIYRITP